MSDPPISPSSDKNERLSCWTCPLCPMIYKRRYHFDKHIQTSHKLQPDEGKYYF